MGCDCGKPKCGGHCGVSPAVLQINNPSECVLFHRVEVPASMGDSKTNPPKNGEYKNVLLYYEADQTSWLYSSDGIPTKLANGLTDYEDAINLPQINGVTLLGNKSLGDLGITDAIDDSIAEEKAEREAADEALGDEIDTINDELLSRAVVFDTVADMKASADLVNGSFARTLGFHSVNDGGGAIYKITNTGVADEMYVIAIGDLRANLIIQDYITPEVLGAYGDNTHDDTAAVQACLSNTTYKHSVLSKVYKISSPLSVPNYKLVDGGGAIYSSSSCFELDGIAHVTIKDLQLYPQLHAIHITTDSSWCNYNVFENIFANGNKNADTKGLFLEVTSHYLNEQTYNNCVFWNFGYGIYALNDTASTEMGAHIFNQCSTELSKTAGQYIKKGNSFRFVNCRHAEATSCIWITEGHCESLLIIGGAVIANTISNMQFSDETNGQIIGGLRYSGIYAYDPVRNGRIVAGKVIPTVDSINTSRSNVTADRTVAYGQQLYLYYNFNTAVDCTLTLPSECYGGNGKINEFYVRTSKADNISTVVIGGVTKVLPAGTHVYRFTLNTAGGGTNWLVEEIVNAV